MSNVCVSPAPAAVWVDTDQSLAGWVNRWRQCPVLFLDTEFVRTDTFYPKPGVIQVGDGEHIVLVDATAISDWTPFAGLLTAPGVVKVIHSCSEDLVVFELLTGQLPRPLFDTQVAAALLGLGSSVSYQNLVNQLLGVEVPKEQTRSDWLRRPLSAEQLEYASLDVHYLAVVWRLLEDRLEACGRAGWALEEGERILRGAQPELPAEAYRKVKLAWQLNRRQLRVLRDLLLWREETARALDIPRGRLIKDDAALLLARRRPRHMGELSALRDLPPASVRRYGERWLELISTAQLASDDDLPASLPPPLNPREGESMKRLRAALERQLQGTDIPPELVLRRRDLELIVREGLTQAPSGLEGWRERYIAPALNEWLEGERDAPVM